MDKPIDQRTARTKLVFRILGGCAFVGGLLFAVRALLAPSVDRADLIVDTVQRGDITATVDVSGMVVPAAESAVPAPYSTDILTVHAIPGQSVSRGDVLLALRSDDQLSAVEDLEEQVQIRENEVASQRITLARSLAQSEGRRELLAIDLESRQARRDRLQQLSGIGAISAGDLLEAQLDVRRTEAELTQLTTELALIRQANATEISGIELELSILKRSLTKARQDVKAARVVAPIDGVVTWVESSAGMSVTKGDVLARVSDLTRYRVEATASDFHAQALFESMPARITIGDQVKTGRLTAIAPAEEAGSLALRIALDQPTDDALRPQLRAAVELITDSRQDTLLVRRGTALSGTGPTFAWIIDGTTARRTEIDLGMVNRRHVEIVAGADEGDEIIVSDTTEFDHLHTIEVTP